MRPVQNIIFYFILFLLMDLYPCGASAAWIQKAPYGGTAKHRCTAFAINNKGYIGLGHTNSVTFTYAKDFWEYDPATNAWSQVADFGGGFRYHATAFTVGDYGYVGLGENENSEYKNDFWKYIPLINTWVQVSNFPGVARRGACSFVIDDLGYVGTGQTETGYSTDFYSYDPSLNSWTAIADFIGIARSSGVAFSNNGKGYVGTGHILGDDTKDFYEYDPSLNLWTQKTDVGITPRQDATAFVVNGEAFIGTGNDVEGNFSFNDFWRYNFETDTWTQAADFDGQGRQYLVSFVINNVAYCGTGTNGTNFRDFWAFYSLLDETENQIEKKEIKVYPNPASEKIRIELLSNESDTKFMISIFDPSGKLILTEILNGNYIELTNDMIGNGCFYYILTDFENIHQQGKFILTQ